MNGSYRSGAEGFPKPRTVSVRLSAELHERIERHCRNKKLSQSDIVREALRHYFATTT